jgi:hypothetical protein
MARRNIPHLFANSNGYDGAAQRVQEIVDGAISSEFQSPVGTHHQRPNVVKVVYVGNDETDKSVIGHLERAFSTIPRSADGTTILVPQHSHMIVSLERVTPVKWVNGAAVDRVVDPVEERKNELELSFECHVVTTADPQEFLRHVEYSLMYRETRSVTAVLIIDMRKWLKPTIPVDRWVALTSPPQFRRWFKSVAGVLDAAPNKDRISASILPLDKYTGVGRALALLFGGQYGIIDMFDDIGKLAAHRHLRSPVDDPMSPLTWYPQGESPCHSCGGPLFQRTFGLQPFNFFYSPQNPKDRLTVRMCPMCHKGYNIQKQMPMDVEDNNGVYPVPAEFTATPLEVVLARAFPQVLDDYRRIYGKPLVAGDVPMGPGLTEAASRVYDLYRAHGGNVDAPLVHALLRLMLDENWISGAPNNWYTGTDAAEYHIVGDIVVIRVPATWAAANQPRLFELPASAFLTIVIGAWLGIEDIEAYDFTDNPNPTEDGKEVNPHFENEGGRRG